MLNKKREIPPSMQSTERRPFPHRRGLIIVTILATAYMASHFFRASNVTIGLDLMRDLAIGPEALGALTGAFFFGFGVMLIGSMVVISRWFPPDRFSTVTAMVMSIGLLGNLAATTPLAWAAQTIGWRSVFSAAVLFTALGSIAVWLVVRDAPPGHPFLARKPEPLH